MMNFGSRFSFQRALLVAALWTAAVQAAPVPAPLPGDLFAGFRASDGQGSATSYLVKLGPDTVFRTAAPGSTFDVAIPGHIGADLAAIFGPSWITRSDVQWGIFGVRTSVNSTVYGSRARNQPQVVAPAWPSLNSTGRNGVAGAITSVLQEVGGYQAGEATANSPVAMLQPNTAEASSYARQVGSPGTSDFSSLSQWTSIEASFGGGADAPVLDLFRIATAGTSHIGSFSINSSGTIHFAAVPAVADGDADGDGFTDVQESVAGTNQNSSNSFPQAHVSLSDNGPRIQTPTAANRTYAIEYSESLVLANWQQIATHASGAAATPVDFLDTDPERRVKGRGYYRIRISS